MIIGICYFKCNHHVNSTAVGLEVTDFIFHLVVSKYILAILGCLGHVFNFYLPHIFDFVGFQTFWSRAYLMKVIRKALYTDKIRIYHVLLFLYDLINTIRSMISATYFAGKWYTDTYIVRCHVEHESKNFRNSFGI